MTQPVLVLASSSPRRRSLLGGVGLSIEVASPDTDESVRAGEDPMDYVRRVAEEKSLAVASPLPVLAADTAVVVDGKTLGKPGDAEAALAMLTLLSDREHLVFSGVALAHHGIVLESLVVETKVAMAAIGAAEAAWYVETREPLDKAGGYAIQGLGGVFVSEIRGSVSNVTGLPLAETVALLRRAGIRPFRERT